MTNQAWRIYYSDALAKTELTQSPARVKWAKEQGHRVVELFEVIDWMPLEVIGDVKKLEHRTILTNTRKYVNVFE